MVELFLTQKLLQLLHEIVVRNADLPFQSSTADGVSLTHNFVASLFLFSYMKANATNPLNKTLSGLGEFGKSF